MPFAFLVILFATTGFAQSKRGSAKIADPPQFAGLVARGAAAREANRLDEAISLYLQALKLKPKWGEGWWFLGSMFYERDQYREGRDAFKNTVAVEPKFAPAWSMLGLCEFQLKEYPAALQHLRHGNSFGFGENEELRRVARYHEAMLLNRFESYELAFDVIRRFINLESESPDVIATIGLAMLRLPYFPGEIPGEKREVVIKTGRATYLSISNHPGQAQKEFRELIEAFPSSPGVHYAYGVFLMRDNPDAALDELRRELRISPQHVAARLQIAFECLKRKEFEMGLPYAEEAVKLAPDLFATHNALGRILLETGDLPRAVKELELSAQQAPDSPEVHFALARAYARAGRQQDAAKARAEFARLEKLRRSQREGIVSDGKSEEKP